LAEVEREEKEKITGETKIRMDGYYLTGTYRAAFLKLFSSGDHFY
jgi:hypothetical protein